MNHLNIEIKAKCLDHEKVKGILKSLNADFKGTDHQIDMYFNVTKGRLKLREGNIENHLIFYERENKEGPKQSNTILFDFVPGSSLKNILINSLGVIVVVDKSREIYFIDNVKFHIDTVKDLGTFVEIEAISENESIEKGKLIEQCNKYLAILGISEKDLVSDSYSDLLLKNTK